MKDYVYLYIEGPDFRPKEFQDCLDDTAKGTIEFHKKVEKGKVLQHKIHWKSRKIEVDNHDLAIEEILCLIEKIKHVFLDTRTAKTTIIAELLISHKYTVHMA